MRAHEIGLAAALGFGVTVFAAVPEAEAGCSDGACGRIDWTEITESTTTEALAAKIHGRYAWESSEGWLDHIVGGSLRGYVWMRCDAADRTCKAALKAEIAKTGTATPFYFRGNFWDYDASKPMQPPVLFAEGKPGTPAGLHDLNPGDVEPFNAMVCPTAFALAPNPPPTGMVPDTGGTDEMPACAAAPGNPHGALEPWLVAAAALLLFPRRRRR